MVNNVSGRVGAENASVHTGIIAIDDTTAADNVVIVKHTIAHFNPVRGHYFPVTNSVIRKCAINGGNIA